MDLLLYSNLFALSTNCSFYKTQHIQLPETKFADQADSTYLRISENLDTVFASLKELSISATSMNKGLPEVPEYPYTEDMEYPPGFLTLRVEDMRYAKRQSNAQVIAYVPLVKSYQENLWQRYTERHMSWIVERQDNPKTTNITAAIPDFIWEFKDYEWEKVRESKGQMELKAETRWDGVGKGSPFPSDYEYVKNDDIYTPIGDGPTVPWQDWQDKIQASSHKRQDNLVVQKKNKDFFAPVWQMVPVPGVAVWPGDTNPFDGIINYNLADQESFKSVAEIIVKYKEPLYFPLDSSENWFLAKEKPGRQESAVVYPVFDDQGNVVGYYVAIMDQIDLFKDRLPVWRTEGWGLRTETKAELEKNVQRSATMDMIVVMDDSCGNHFIVEMEGQDRVTPFNSGRFNSNPFKPICQGSDCDQYRDPDWRFKHRDPSSKFSYFADGLSADSGLLDPEMVKYEKVYRFPSRLDKDEMKSEYAWRLCETTVRMYPKRKNM